MVVMFQLPCTSLYNSSCSEDYTHKHTPSTELTPSLPLFFHLIPIIVDILWKPNALVLYKSCVCLAETYICTYNNIPVLIHTHTLTAQCQTYEHAGRKCTTQTCCSKKTTWNKQQETSESCHKQSQHGAEWERERM